MEVLSHITEAIEVLIIVLLVVWNSKLQKRIEKLENKE